jgi:hypothetical protein
VGVRGRPVCARSTVNTRTMAPFSPQFWLNHVTAGPLRP